MLGMKDTRYVEPTGLSSRNQSSAQDLALLVNAAYADATVRQLSTSPEYQVEVGNRVLQYNTTNRLVKSPDWDIGLQKTGYISEAGQCLVMQARIAGRKLIMVFLDSAGKLEPHRRCRARAPLGRSQPPHDQPGSGDAAALHRRGPRRELTPRCLQPAEAPARRRLRRPAAHWRL